jgi:hypothetical protein
MQIEFVVDSHDLLTVRLTEGQDTTTMTVISSRAAVESLRRAFRDATTEGYGECFWPAATGGQYWWVFRRDAESIEVAAMWTRGGASLWEHVFRATDALDWVGGRLDDEAKALGLDA